MWKNKDAIIFDLDGTVVDSMWVWPEVDIEFLGERGYSLPEDLQKDLDGKSFFECAVYMKKRFSLQESEEELMAIWNRMAFDMYTSRVRLKPGVEAFMKQAKAAGKKLGIASSNSHLLVEATLKANGVFDYLDSIHTANEVGKGKPAPDIYLLVAKDLDVAPEKCLVFEDIVVGIQAGKNAGMEACAVWDASCMDTVEEKKAVADYYIDSFEELL